MAKRKRKLTKAERAAKAARKAEFEIIFVNGKQKRVRRQVMIEGMTVEEFILANADPIWLHQNQMWEYMEPTTTVGDEEPVLNDGDDEEFL
jgi:hypothetical protein